VELPSGTVTFLFTDVERSTETARALGDERWAEVLEAHQALLRPAFERHRGVEVATEGDAFFVAFASADDAVAAAIDGQRALLDGSELRVRMGMHTGVALVRSNDYIGHDVHTAKRVSDTGHGGQIVVSQTTADLVSSNGLLVDLGLHQLKDLGEPQHLFQVVADGLPSDFPPLRSLGSFRNNLPAQRSVLIGRDAEIATISKLLDEHRLVTLTGIGGCGKTRLALQVAAELIDRSPDGTFFIDLAPLSDFDQVDRTIAATLGLLSAGGLPGAGADGADAQITGFLASRRCLVIFDNCEHLLDACARTADLILSRCPDVRLLATSREPLGVDGEHSFIVPSLALPGGAEDPADSEAVRLFVERATAVRPDFEPSRETLSVIVDICRRLDGIPLAIEFAAARVTHLTVKEIADRLDAMFRLLTGGRRRVQRQQTLQATLDWSYDLLSPSEQELLRRLAVFVGDFSLAAVEGICSGDAVDTADVLDLMGSLVAKSLVLTSQRVGSTRYRLLEPVRLYAEEKLRLADEAEVFRRRHRDWYEALVRSFSFADALLDFGAGHHLAAEQANVERAIEWSVTEGAADSIARMATRYGWHWSWQTSPLGVSMFVDWFDAATGLDHDERIDFAAAALSNAIGAFDPRGAEIGDRAAELAGDAVTGGAACLWLSRGAVIAIRAAYSGDEALAAEALANTERSIEIARSVSPAWTSLCLAMAAWTNLTLFRPREAYEAIRESMPLYTDDTIVTAELYGATAAHIVGDHDSAVRWSESVLGRTDDSGNWFGLGPGWFSLAATGPAVAFAGVGDLDRARSILTESFEAGHRFGNTGVRGSNITAAAAIAAIAGDHRRAGLIFAWVFANTYARGLPNGSPAAWVLYRHYVPIVRAALGPDEAHRIRDEGARLSADEAFRLASEVCEG
jgi:predicted ATPase/class 3 adenylate cyclase